MLLEQTASEEMVYKLPADLYTCTMYSFWVGNSSALSHLHSGIQVEGAAATWGTAGLMAGIAQSFLNHFL